MVRRFCRAEKSRTVEGSGLGLRLFAAVVACTVTVDGGDSGRVVEIASSLYEAGADDVVGRLAE